MAEVHSLLIFKIKEEKNKELNISTTCANICSYESQNKILSTWFFVYSILEWLKNQQPIKMYFYKYQVRNSLNLMKRPKTYFYFIVLKDFFQVGHPRKCHFLCPSVRLSIFPSIAHHILGIEHHVVIGTLL